MEAKFKIGDTVVRDKATSSSMLPKGTRGVVLMVTAKVLVLKEYPGLALPLEDFSKQK